MPIDEYANITPIERQAEGTHTTPRATLPYGTRTTTMPIETRTYVKAEDDRSLGEKAKDALSNAADKFIDLLAGEIKNEDIAQAALKQEQLTERAKMDRMQAETAANQKERLAEEAQRMQDNELKNKIQARQDHERADEQAQEVIRLQNKQAQQQAKKCHQAVLAYPDLPPVGCVNLYMLTESH